MSRAQYSQLLAAAPGRILIAGHFHPDTANPVTGLVGEGVTSVTRTGQGEFTVLLADDYVAIEWAHAHAGMSAVTDLDAQVGDIVADPATGGATVKIHTRVAGVATDIAANANNTVFFAIVAKRDSGF